MRWILLLVVWSLLVAACGTSTSDPTIEGSVSTPPTSIVVSPPTVPPPATTITTPPPTTTPSALEHAPTLLVAHSEGIDLWTPERVTPVLRGREMEVAFPDLAGGVIFSGGEELGLYGPIEWVPQVGDEPQILIEDPDPGSVHPVQVTLVEGRRTLVYRRWIELPNDCENDPDPECTWPYSREYLILRDLDTGSELNLGMIASFESYVVVVSLGGSWAAIGYQECGVRVVPVDLLVDGASDQRWIGEESELLKSVGLSYPECDHMADAPLIARDGLSYLEVQGSYGLRPTLTIRVLATETGDEIMSTEIRDPSVHAHWYDFDGTHTIIGQVDTTPMLLIDLDGTITELDIEGRATIWSDS